MNRKGVLRELSQCGAQLGIIEAVARIEGLEGLAEGMSKIRKDIKDWYNMVKEAGVITFPEEGE